MIEIPKDFEVQPIRGLRLKNCKNAATCFTCGLSWDDGKSTSYTPTPSGRCPFEAFHEEPPEPMPKTDWYQRFCQVSAHLKILSKVVIDGNQDAALQFAMQSEGIMMDESDFDANWKDFKSWNDSGRRILKGEKAVRGKFHISQTSVIT